MSNKYDIKKLIERLRATYFEVRDFSLHDVRDAADALEQNLIDLEEYRRDVEALTAERDRLRNEKVAGGPTGLEHEAQVGSVSSPAPATDPEVVRDTPVCIWVSHISKDRSGRYSHSWVICDGTHVQYCADNMSCFVCGRPIKFAGGG